MRTKYSVLNAIVVVVLNIVTILIGFISQKIFINILGIEYLGVNGLFTNILSMLAIVELGLGSAIVFHLYKPIANNNKDEIKSLMHFYKVGYRIVAIIVSVIGLFMILFLSKIIGQVSVSENITYLYLLCLGDVVVSYLLTYKRSILYASQKTYIINIVHIIYLILMNSVQLLILYKTKNYSLYLWVKIVFRIIENLVITYIANKMYPFLKEKNINPIDKKTKSNIISKIKGLLYHKVGTFIVLGTDNIIISAFLGIKYVGLYDNYYLILNKVQNLFSQMFNSLTASVGNLLIEDDINKSYRTYKNMLFINSWIFMIASSIIICTIQPFIIIWIGEEYILSFEVLIVLIINFYIQGLRITNLTFKNAAGVFYEDRFMPIVEAVVNIFVSIILVKRMGLVGVFLGTISSTVILYVYGYYKYVYSYIFKKNYLSYLKDFIPLLIIPIIAVGISYFATLMVNVNNYIYKIAFNALIAFACCNLIYLLAFYRTEEFEFLELFIKNNIFKLLKHKKFDNNKE